MESAESNEVLGVGIVGWWLEIISGPNFDGQTLSVGPSRE